MMIAVIARHVRSRRARYAYTNETVNNAAAPFTVNGHGSRLVPPHAGHLTAKQAALHKPSVVSADTIAGRRYLSTFRIYRRAYIRPTLTGERSFALNYPSTRARPAASKLLRHSNPFFALSPPVARRKPVHLVGLRFSDRHHR